MPIEKGRMNGAAKMRAAAARADRRSRNWRSKNAHLFTQPDLMDDLTRSLARIVQQKLDGRDPFREAQKQHLAYVAEEAARCR